MKIKLSLSFSIERSQKDDTPEAPEVLEHSGSTTEIFQQPRYTGFAVPGEELD